ncbi:MAG: HigA family addiction module antidote protein [Treponema sp.]|nr:HigA family addiction module antidote protein [Treponema sp.]
MAQAFQAPGPFLASMLEKYKLNPFKLSKDIHLSQSAVRLITIGQTKITVSVAMRLAQYFNTNPEFWLAMQMKWDIAEASRDKALMKIIEGIPRVSKGTAGKSAAAKKPVAKKTASKKKAVSKSSAKKTVTKKKAVGTKKSAAKKPVAKRKAVAAKKSVTKKPVARKKPVAAKKKVVVKARKTTVPRAKPTVRRGRSVSKK